MNPLNIIGSLLGFASGGLGFLTNIPFVWNLVRNYGSVKKSLTDIFDVVNSAKDKGGLPTIEDTKKLVAAAALIFEKDLIDLPELDEHKFATQLRQVERALGEAIENARKEKGLPNVG